MHARDADTGPPKIPPIAKEDYKRSLYQLHIELVKLQSHIIRTDAKLLVLMEGRDAAGKDGTIKRVIQHLSPRETRVVALGAPSDRDKTSWYFQRFVPHLPTAREIVLFNRSWYNRAGVERVMGFCRAAEYETFIGDAPRFEEMLLRAGIVLRKYYLDIHKRTQKKRLEDRRRDPLKQWKTSPIDEVALKNWEKYSEARNEMFARTHTVVAPWHIVRADDKRVARLGLIRDLLIGLDYKGKKSSVLRPDPAVVFSYSETAVARGWIAP